MELCPNPRMFNIVQKYVDANSMERLTDMKIMNIGQRFWNGGNILYTPS